MTGVVAVDDDDDDDYDVIRLNGICTHDENERKIVQNATEIPTNCMYIEKSAGIPALRCAPEHLRYTTTHNSLFTTNNVEKLAHLRTPRRAHADVCAYVHVCVCVLSRYHSRRKLTN